MTAAIADAARRLLDAEARVETVPPLTDAWAGLDVQTAYQIQDELLRLRVERGERLVGLKLGLTSVAKQKAMGVDLPLVAWLTDAMLLAPTDALGTDLIHPRAEPEIVFVMERSLSGPRVTMPEALGAVGSVWAGIEVIDSRYTDFRFTLPDVIADNASAARFVLGPRSVRPYDVDLSVEACLLNIDGTTVASATGAAVQGHPGQAPALGANILAERGLAIEAGWIVLTGGMTEAAHVPPGTTAVAEFTHLGSVVLDAGSRRPSSSAPRAPA